MTVKDIKKLADFKEIPFSELNESFSLPTISNDLFEIEDLFGDEPENVFYFKGDIHITEDLIIKNPDDYAYFIIDGNLKVDRTLSICVWDMYNPIGITGNLDAKNLLLSSEAFLCTLGKAKIENIIYNDISDSGACVFHKEVSANKIITSMYGNFEFVETDKVIGDQLSETSLKEKFEDAEFEYIQKAIINSENICNE